MVRVHCSNASLCTTLHSRVAVVQPRCIITQDSPRVPDETARIAGETRGLPSRMRCLDIRRWVPGISRELPLSGRGFTHAVPPSHDPHVIFVQSLRRPRTTLRVGNSRGALTGCRGWPPFPSRVVSVNGTPTAVPPVGSHTMTRLGESSRRKPVAVSRWPRPGRRGRDPRRAAMGADRGSEWRWDPLGCRGRGHGDTKARLGKDKAVSVSKCDVSVMAVDIRPG